MPPAALGAASPASSGTMSSTRVTVLPRVENEGEAVRLVRDERARSHPRLDMGGMGEVIPREQSGHRPGLVAIKRLLPEFDDAATWSASSRRSAPWAELEHPNIVPISDIRGRRAGPLLLRDEVRGGGDARREAAAGDTEYHKRYTMERRTENVLGVLHALDFAHSHGVSAATSSRP